MNTAIAVAAIAGTTVVLTAFVWRVMGPGSHHHDRRDER